MFMKRKKKADRITEGESVRYMDTHVDLIPNTLLDLYLRYNHNIHEDKDKEITHCCLK